VSGGYIDEQEEGDHTVVTFTFVGALTPEQAEQWNNAVLDLKRRFGTNLIGVTTKAETTPAHRLAAQKRPPGEG
jgi:hypothetical protein